MNEADSKKNFFVFKNSQRKRNVDITACFVKLKLIKLKVAESLNGLPAYRRINGY